MDAEKYNRQVTLLCPTCGNSQFQYEEDEQNSAVICVSCKRELTRDELIHENSEAISNNINEMGNEIVKDTAKKLRDIFKRLK
jgi:predicted RNA-binding Zn-ribbon protein involved in translation (DUF1610 family)